MVWLYGIYGGPTKVLLVRAQYGNSHDKHDKKTICPSSSTSNDADPAAENNAKIYHIHATGENYVYNFY